MSTADRIAVARRDAPAAVAARPAPWRRAARLVPAVLLPFSGLLVWWLAVRLFDPRPWLLPSPGSVGRVIVEDRARLWFHAQATLGETLVGLGLAVGVGLLLAVAVSASRTADRVVSPWIVASQAIPVLAVAPLVAVWLDYGAAQVLVAFVIAVFPVVVAGADALRGVDPQLGRAARTLGAGRGWVWRHVTLPAALPGILSGVRMAAVFAVTGAVVSEYVGADRGLGYLSEFSTAQFETATTFAAIALLALIGIVLFALVGLVERLLLPHRRRPVRPHWSPR